MRLWVALLLAGVAAAADLNSLFAPLVNQKSPGMAVVVRKDGRTVFASGYGVRELRTFADIDRTTNFRLASFTKQFTAMATMLLVRDRKLRYDERLTDIFPDFPAYGRNITIRHLLTHTSGLPDYEDLMDDKWTATRQIQDDEVLALLKATSSPKFVAGKSWAYSNSGYVVLGLIAARVSGMRFGQLLETRIFKPLGMARTVVFEQGKNTVAGRAYGHSRKGGVWVETDQSSTSATLGDGGIYSNIDDLVRWDEAMEKHTLLNDESMKAALTPVRLADGSQPEWPAKPGEDNLNPGKPVFYGFGWFLDPYEGRTRMWHSGTTTGFRTIIQRFPAERLTVILLCNRTDVDATQLALQAYAIAHQL